MKVIRADGWERGALGREAGGAQRVSWESGKESAVYASSQCS